MTEILPLLMMMIEGLRRRLEVVEDKIPQDTLGMGSRGSRLTSSITKELGFIGRPPSDDS
jgi:hypothetical protein